MDGRPQRPLDCRSGIGRLVAFHNLPVVGKDTEPGRDLRPRQIARSVAFASNSDRAKLRTKLVLTTITSIKGLSPISRYG